MEQLATLPIQSWSEIAPVHELQEFGYLIISSRRIRAFRQRLSGKHHNASRQSPSES